MSDDDLHPNDKKRRDYLIQMLTIGSLGVTSAIPVQAGWFSSEPEKLENRSIHSLRGTIQVNGNQADIDTPIMAGDTVTTKRDSEVIFVVGSDSFVLRSNTEMAIEGDGFFVNTLRLLSGSLLSVFGKRNSGNPLGLVTATATIGIRGTGAYLEAEPDLTYLCTCYGQVALSANADPNDSQILTAVHHDVPKYISSKSSGSSRIQAAPVKNHSDVELKLLETIVGRELPEGFQTESRKESYDK